MPCMPFMWSVEKPQNVQISIGIWNNLIRNTRLFPFAKRVLSMYLCTKGNVCETVKYSMHFLMNPFKFTNTMKNDDDYWSQLKHNLWYNVNYSYEKWNEMQLCDFFQSCWMFNATKYSKFCNLMARYHFYLIRWWN